MSTDELLGIVTERGLRVILRPPGQLSLAGPRPEMTPALMRVLKLHREMILERLRAKEGLHRA